VIAEASTSSSTFSPNRNSIISPSSFREFRDESETDLKRKQTDYYTSRESDFYYGVRGPALSSTPSRRRITGPADPMSPVVSASGWFKTLLGGRKKEKGKGFEVVRSTPLHLLPTEEEEESPPPAQEPYRDSPPLAASAAKQDISDEEKGKGAAMPGKPSRILEYGTEQKYGRVSEAPPLLRQISTSSGNFGLRGQSESDEIIGFPADAASRQPKRSRARTASSEQNNLISGGGPSHQQSSSGRQRQFSSSDDTGHRVPFGSDAPHGSRDRDRDSSMTSSIYPPEEVPMVSVEHPGAFSTGHVGRHLASSSIHVYDGDMNPALLGSTAELVDVDEAKKQTK
jgi:hypothetical protein